jgi:hypothetical protein
MAELTTARDLLTAKISNLSETEVSELLDYVKIMETMRVQADQPDLFEDELISMLANSTESRRARTVVEWDKVRRRVERAGFATFRYDLTI